MIEDAYALLSEASKLRGDAMLAVRETGVPVKEIAERLHISGQRAYQLLTEAKGRSRAPTAS
jgi:orotate phosphoribosyltransferase-like protein